MYSYSTDSKRYIGDFSTKELAIHGARQHLLDNPNFNETVFIIMIGENKPFVPRISGNIDLKNDLVNQAIDEDFGDEVDDYVKEIKLEHIKVLESRLDKVLTDWLIEFGYVPDFYSVENVEAVGLEFTAEELASREAV